MLFDTSLKEISTKSDETIFVPMAGQLLTRNLKVFDNCTFYFKYSEKEIPDLTSPINTYQTASTDEKTIFSAYFRESSLLQWKY